MEKKPRPQFRFLAWVFGFYTLLILYFSTNFYLLSPDLMEEGSYTKILGEDAAMWYPWALLTPLILWLGRRFSLARLKWQRFVPFHIGAGAILSLTRSTMSYFLYQGGALLGWTSSYSLPRIFRESINFGVLTYGIILGVLYAVEFYRKYRDRELVAAQLETKLTQANLQVLKAQIHPHFLFNALHAVSSLLDKDPKKADEVISCLSEFLRLTLDRSNAQEVPLKEEVESLKLYLAIMKTRLEDRLNVNLSFPPDTFEALVPSFILQPLVENSVRYGVAPRRSGGTIHIAAEKRGGRLLLRVQDTGPGFGVKPEALLNKGLGLSTTEKRLTLLYGNGKRMILRDREEGGAEVLIEIPFHIEARV